MPTQQDWIFIVFQQCNDCLLIRSSLAYAYVDFPSDIVISSLWHHRTNSNNCFSIYYLLSKAIGYQMHLLGYVTSKIYSGKIIAVIKVSKCTKHKVNSPSCHKLCRLKSHTSGGLLLIKK